MCAIYNMYNIKYSKDYEEYVYKYGLTIMQQLLVWG